MAKNGQNGQNDQNRDLGNLRFPTFSPKTLPGFLGSFLTLGSKMPKTAKMTFLAKNVIFDPKKSKTPNRKGVDF